MQKGKRDDSGTSQRCSTSKPSLCLFSRLCACLLNLGVEEMVVKKRERYKKICMAVHSSVLNDSWQLFQALSFVI